MVVSVDHWMDSPHSLPQIESKKEKACMIKTVPQLKVLILMIFVLFGGIAPYLSIDMLSS